MFTTASEMGSTTEVLVLRVELSTLLVLAAAADPVARLRRPGKVDLVAEAMVRTRASSVGRRRVSFFLTSSRSSSYVATC